MSDLTQGPKPTPTLTSLDLVESLRGGGLYSEEPRIPWDHPVLTADARALWNGNEGWVWILPESDGDSFYFTLDAENPSPRWMDYVCEVGGLGEALFPECHSGLEYATALLVEGIAPDQPFFIHLSFSSGVDWAESWTEVDWRLLDVERLPPEEVARRWGAWLKRRGS